MSVGCHRSLLDWKHDLILNREGRRGCGQWEQTEWNRILLPILNCLARVTSVNSCIIQRNASTRMEENSMKNRIPVKDSILVANIRSGTVPELGGKNGPVGKHQDGESQSGKPVGGVQQIQQCHTGREREAKSVR